MHGVNRDAFRVLLAMGLALAAGLTVGDQVSAQAKRRAVFLAITAPNAKAPAQVATLEDDIATLSLPDLGKFGFRPKLLATEGRLTVTILDLQSDPPKPLGEVALQVGAKLVQSKTVPSFGLEVLRIGSSQ